MALEQQIQEDIKTAMKAHDAVATAATRAIKGEILIYKTSECGSKEVTDADILKMIQKLIKQRKESAEQFTAAGRQVEGIFNAQGQRVNADATGILIIRYTDGTATKLVR